MRTVLEEREKHFYAQYPLVSTAAPLTFEQVMCIAGERLRFEDAVRATLLRLKGTEEVDLRIRMQRRGCSCFMAIGALLELGMC